MINYSDGYFGLHTLFRVYGSAAYKGMLAACVSSGFYILMWQYKTHITTNLTRTGSLLDHPYPVTVIVTAVMFLLSAKVTFSYNRFWEACTALHSMHSRWLDVALTICAYHMQSKAYKQIQPPSFGDNPHIYDRMELRYSDGESADETNNKTIEKKNYTRSKFRDSMSRMLHRRKGKASDNDGERISIQSAPTQSLPFPDYKIRRRKQQSHNGTYHTAHDQTNGWSALDTCHESNTNSGTIPPSPFLQEAAHLVSLLSAVALSTLRCDSEDAEAPLTTFVPGHHWPNYNSDNDPDMKEYGYHRNVFLRTFKYLFDVSRTKRERLAYNAARPFPVIGGVSDKEASMLQSARGAPAKTALVSFWLNEFIIREQLHGSFGMVGAPIISRLQQYSSEGNLWYNSARKMSYIPFPFPHTQMTILFELICVILMPSLMLSTAEPWFGFVLNFWTVLLFAGLNELSKELEYPFRCMPNDLPLSLFQAQFNEAIVVTFSGWHPDFHSTTSRELPVMDEEA